MVCGKHVTQGWGPDSPWGPVLLPPSQTLYSVYNYPFKVMAEPAQG